MECFGSTVQSEVLEQLRSDAPYGPPTQRLSDSQLELFIDDMRQLSTGRDRISLLRELLLPSGQLLLSKYNKTSRLWLPLLYLRRLFGGARELLFPP
jgi:hypothetical protein